MKKFISLLSITVGGIISGFAADYVVVAKDGNVYDEASARYITVNQNNEDVAVMPGMVFETSEHTPGWFKIEYTPGLHAFLPDQIVASSLKSVPAGIYEIKNNPGQKLSAENSGGNWSATVDGKTYKGKSSQDVLLFIDNGNNIAFSIVDLGDGPIAITYDNSVTKFF